MNRGIWFRRDEAGNRFVIGGRCGRTVHPQSLMGLRVIATVLMVMMTGCAAFRPLDGMPARFVPDSIKSPSRSNQKTIDLSLLAQRKPPEHLVGPGDILGIYIDGVLGKPNEAPPVRVATNQLATPSVGFPIPVRSDGSLSLPLLKEPLRVEGLTLAQVEALILQAYTVKQKTLNPNNARVLVSLQQPRTYRVMVVRQEAGTDLGTSVGDFNPGALKRGSGQVVTLPVYENDVMHALAATQGLPGLDAQNTIYIVRQRQAAPAPQPRPTGKAGAKPRFGHSEPATHSRAVPANPSVIQRTSGWLPNAAGPAGMSSANAYSYRAGYGLPRHMHPATASNINVNNGLGTGGMLDGAGSMATVTDGQWVDGAANPLTIENPRILTIPIRLGATDRPSFQEQDVILQDGDIVFIESRDTEIFYTGGLLGGGQFTLPRDYDLDVLGAIAIAQGRSLGQMSDTSMFGVSALNQDVSVSASKLIVLRTMPNGSQVPIKVDLYTALRNPAERLTVQPGDYLMLQYTPLEAVGAFFERYILRSAVFGLAASQVNKN